MEHQLPLFMMFDCCQYKNKLSDTVFIFWAWWMKIWAFKLMWWKEAMGKWSVLYTPKENDSIIFIRNIRRPGRSLVQHQYLNIVDFSTSKAYIIVRDRSYLHFCKWLEEREQWSVHLLSIHRDCPTTVMESSWAGMLGCINFWELLF